MSNWEDPQVAKSICDAASEWGLFQIVNHEVPVEVLENVKEKVLEWKDYLSLFYVSEEEASTLWASTLWPPVYREQVLDYMNKDHLPSNNVRFGRNLSPEKALSWKEYLSLFYVSEEEASALWPHVCTYKQRVHFTC
ncbi:hypothetical protein DITRI_Ditri16bG0081400 [Diplodiscus trichospermus]